jgi:hypothetical protein
METQPSSRFDFGIASDLVSLGQDPEDGSPRIGHRWFVSAEDVASGRRWRHAHSVVTTDGEEPEELRCLLARIVAHGISPVGREHWREAEPAYGSTSYRAQEPEMVLREVQDEIDGLL